MTLPLSALLSAWYIHGSHDVIVCNRFKIQICCNLSFGKKIHKICMNLLFVDSKSISKTFGMSTCNRLIDKYAHMDQRINIYRILTRSP